MVRYWFDHGKTGHVMVGSKSECLSILTVFTDHSQDKSREASVMSQNIKEKERMDELVCFHQIGLIHKQAIVCTMGRLSGEANS